MHLSRFNKCLIIIAIKKTADRQLLNWLNNKIPTDHETLLLQELRCMFPMQNARGSASFPPSTISPDILIEGVCVGEVKRRRRSNMSADNKNQIKGYVEHFRVPGFLVLFDPYEEHPVVARVRWYSINSFGIAHKENFEWEKIYDDNCYDEEIKLLKNQNFNASYFGNPHRYESPYYIGEARSLSPNYYKYNYQAVQSPWKTSSTDGNRNKTSKILLGIAMVVGVLAGLFFVISSMYSCGH
ncbi:UNVERIFIED_CONTAM: hypothetical protein RMT77_002053 [Armadillidium vulgare]